MKISFRRYVLGASAFLFLACTSNKDKDSGMVHSHLSVGVVANGDLSPKDKAETMAKQAEVLLDAQGFLEAADVVDLALKEDPDNFRAGFIKAFLAPVLTSKGILTRVRPLAEKNGKALARYNEILEADVNTKPDSNFKHFLFDGHPDILTEDDLQKQMDRTIEALDQFRLFIKSAKVEEIAVKVNSFLVPDVNQRFANACRIETTENYEYELICPPSENRYNIVLNTADFSSLRDAVSGWMISLIASSAYDSSGALEAKDQMDKQGADDLQALIDGLMKNQKFGRLNAGHRLKKIKELGLDLATSIRWMLGQQADLCPQGMPDPKNRPGKLFTRGFCYIPAIIPYVDQVESILKGENQDLLSERDGQSHQTTVVPSAFWENPVTDLRTLGAKFDKCNKLQSLSDITAGGIFPKGDVNVVLPLRIEGCAK